MKEYIEGWNDALKIVFEILNSWISHNKNKLVKAEVREIKREIKIAMENNNHPSSASIKVEDDEQG